MGQKVNPHGFRVGIIKDWDSRWFVKDSEFGKTLYSDYNLRKFLKKQLFDAGVPKIEIERNNQIAKVIIHCARPGKVIGRAGSEVDKIKGDIARILGKPLGEVSVSVAEIRTPDLNAQLVAENIAAQLENRVSFRRAMKQAIARTMKLGAKGIKVAVSGLLGGTDIARTEHYHEGTIPLQTIRADIDYGQHAALTKMGLLGVKVWIYKGEVLTAVKRGTEISEERNKSVRENFNPRRPRGDRSTRDSGDDKQFTPQSDRPPREGGFRDNRKQGEGGQNRSGGDNRGDRRGGRGGRDRAPAAPPTNYGNRKTGAPISRPRRPAEEPAAEENTAPKQAAEQAEGGNTDVNA
ncbi:MAG: 30S ribosomal protein S3 [Oscillospiraceae bacterium]|nr:30S ribosomal protein S3 [Oscillospiraceae bacterium]